METFPKEGRHGEVDAPEALAEPGELLLAGWWDLVERRTGLRLNDRAAPQVVEACHRHVRTLIDEVQRLPLDDGRAVLCQGEDVLGAHGGEPCIPDRSLWIVGIATVHVLGEHDTQAEETSDQYRREVAPAAPEGRYTPIPGHTEET